jgi:hypothetical protein
MGVTPDGQAKPNGFDFWWDGQGHDNCWQRGTSRPSEPFTLPGCGPDGNPVLFGTARYVAEPLKMVKLLTCNEYRLRTASIPDGCDWFGAQGLSRIEVQIAAGEAALLAVPLLLQLLGLFFRRRPETNRRVAAPAIAGLVGLAGLVLGIFGAANEGAPLLAVGLALLGCWWLYTGLALRANHARKLGALTLTLGVLALLGAVDAGLWMLPWTPVSPTWPRLILELVWVPWAILAALSGLRKVSRSEVPIPAAAGAV